MIPLIVSFHTGGPYAALAAQLEASVRRFEYECSIVEIASRGDYWLNCAMKPGFLAEAMEKHDRDLLWIDADAAIVAELDAGIFTGRFDVRVAYFYGRFSSGTIFLRNTAATRRFLAEWTRRQALSPSRPDEDVMGDVLRSGVEGLQVDLLPPGYLYVFDVWKKLYRNRLKPVILHKQASRASIPGRHRQHEDVAKAFRR